MAFSSTAQWLAVSSDKGTVHVFSLKVNSSVPEQEKSQNSLNSDAAIAPASSSRSFIKFKGVFCYSFYWLERFFQNARRCCFGIVNDVIIFMIFFVSYREI